MSMIGNITKPKPAEGLAESPITSIGVSPVVWIDADDKRSLVFDWQTHRTASAGREPALVGIANKGAMGGSFVLDDPAQPWFAPEWWPGAVNGRGAIYGRGIRNRLRLSPPASTGPLHLYADASTHTKVTAFTVFVPCMSKVQGAPNFIWDMGNFPGAGYGVMGHLDNVQVYTGTDHGGAAFEAGHESEPWVPSVVRGEVVLGDRHDIYVDGQFIHSEGITLTALDDSTIVRSSTYSPEGPMTLGAIADENYTHIRHLVGFVCEVVIYLGDLTSSQVGQIEEHLAEKWSGEVVWCPHEYQDDLEFWVDPSSPALFQSGGTFLDGSTPSAFDEVDDKGRHKVAWFDVDPARLPTLNPSGLNGRPCFELGLDGERVALSAGDDDLFSLTGEGATFVAVLKPSADRGVSQQNILSAGVPDWGEHLTFAYDMGLANYTIGPHEIEVQHSFGDDLVVLCGVTSFAANGENGEHLLRINGQVVGQMDMTLEKFEYGVELSTAGPLTLFAQSDSSSVDERNYAGLAGDIFVLKRPLNNDELERTEAALLSWYT